MIYILKTILDKQKASKNSFPVTTFKVEQNSRTFQGLAQKFKDFSRTFQDSTTPVIAMPLLQRARLWLSV